MCDSGSRRAFPGRLSGMGAGGGAGLRRLFIKHRTARPVGTSQLPRSEGLAVQPCISHTP